MHYFRALTLGAFTVAAAIYFFCVSSPNAFALIILDDVMSKEEEKRTGVNKMNHNQRMALEEWLNKNFILKAQAERSETATNDAIFLSENLDGGQRLKLSDGSIYQIAPDDLARSSLWITPIEIKISQGTDPNFPYLLINVDSGSALKAKQVQGPTINQSR